jgi:signal transduction histidine kinase
MMQEHQADLPQFLTRDDKGKQLPEFLAKLADFLAQEQTTVLGELDQLNRSLDHIKQIVSAQQQFARCGEHKEGFALPEIIEDAINMNILALGRHGVTIEKQFNDCPAVFSDKHKLLQILVNLISNAKKAVKDASAPEKKITVTLDAIQRNGNTVARLRVIDNGVGIPAENLQKIFQHGFTTRSDGHGFGLHSAAITARNLGGSLSATSDGVGKGATFTLELPTATTETAVGEVANA